MVRLAGIFSRLHPAKVLVIGDFMLDTYTVGKVKRISPEAPVGVVHVHHEEHRVGGAGNVILNLASLGAQVVAVGRVGNDHAGKILLELLEKEEVSCHGLFTQAHYLTPIKNRIIADNQQIVRVDHEKLDPLDRLLEQQIIASLPALLEGVKVIAISDYGKGFLSSPLLSAIIDLARKSDIQVIADPKGIDFAKYSGATILKPNLSEAYAAANLPLDTDLSVVAEKLLTLSQVDKLAITRSEAGISLFHRNGSREDYPVKVREVKDVTGAGDTVLAMFACALANGLTLGEAAQLANIAAAIAIERFGCARISLADLANSLLTLDSSSRVFDSDHLFALTQALQGKKTTLLNVSSSNGMTPSMMKYICQLGKDPHVDLLVYIRDANPCQDFITMLTALRDVDFILLGGDDSHHLSELLPLHESHHI